MIAKIQNDFQTPSAFKFYGFILNLSLFSSLVHLLWDVFINAKPGLFIIYLLLTVANLICYWMKSRRTTMAYSVFVFVFFQVLGFIGVWLYDGGMQGPGSSLFFTLLVIFLVIFPQTYKLYLIGVFCSIILLLSQFYETGIDQKEFRFGMLWIDYITNAIVIAFTLIYFKKELDEERRLIAKYNNQIEDVALELVNKKSELVNQRIKIEELTSNLEEIIAVRTHELELKNKDLSKHAFDNAHILRAPLSNILGVIELLTLKGNSEMANSENVEILQSKAVKLDEMVKKINEILK